MTAPASPRLNPALGWGLVTTLLATGWALWWPGEAPSDHEPRQALAASAAPASRSPSASSATGAATPDDPPTLSPSARDPFFPAPVPAPIPETKPTPEPARAEAAPPPPPPPAPPPMTHRVIGRFQSPEGQWLVFLQDGAHTVVAAPGVTLASGYAVESVTAKEVRLRHPLAEQAVSLPLPEDNSP